MMEPKIPISRIDQLIDLEARLAQAGKAEQELSYVHRVRVLEGNYKLAEGLTSIEGDEWQKVRTLISRGALTEARACLETLSENLKSEAEKQFEQARIDCYSGKFDKALSEVERILKSGGLNPLSQMTAFQLKAVCQFEMGQYLDCLSACDRISAFETLFPKAEASFYGRITRVRALAALGCYEGITKEETEIFKAIKRDHYPLNQILQLLMFVRMKCYLLRTQLLPLSLWAKAGLRLAQSLGSPIHEGFFWMELKTCEQNSLRKLAEKEVRSFAERFEIISYYNQKMLPLPDCQENTGEMVGEEKVNQIAFLNQAAIWSFETKRLQSIAISEQNRLLLGLLADGSIHKELFFQQGWGLTFHPLRHDSVIRTALKRLRDQTGIPIKSNEGQLSVRETLLLK